MVRAITAVLAALTATLFGVAVLSPTASADPYPPSQPCAVAVRDTAVSADRYEVTGTGLGAVQPVRLLLATTGRTLGYTRTDGNGQFRAVVQAPRETDGTTPRIAASSAQRTCPGRPPGTTSTSPPGPPGTTGPGAPIGTPAIPPRGTAGTGSGTAGAGGAGAPPTAAAGGGTTTTPGTTAPASGTPSAPASGSASATDATPGSPSDTATRSGSRSVSVPPRADPSPTEPSFGIGLAIAAVLLVLGTLGVLLLTRRPEH